MITAMNEWWVGGWNDLTLCAPIRFDSFCWSVVWWWIKCVRIALLFLSMFLSVMLSCAESNN